MTRHIQSSRHVSNFRQQFLPQSFIFSFTRRETKKKKVKLFFFSLNHSHKHDLIMNWEWTRYSDAFLISFQFSLAFYAHLWLHVFIHGLFQKQLCMLCSFSALPPPYGSSLLIGWKFEEQVDGVAVPAVPVKLFLCITKHKDGTTKPPQCLCQLWSRFQKCHTYIL